MTTTVDRPLLPRLALVFVAAMAVRWIYALSIYGTFGDAGLLGPDSHNYARLGAEFFKTLEKGSAFSWLGADVAVMPILIWVIAVMDRIAGDLGPILFVLLQGAIDAGTCCLVAGLASTIDRRFALPAAIVAALNPTQIVMSGLVYPDTIFVFFIGLFLYASLRWMHAPSWRWALMIGAGFAAAALTRILVVPWLPVHLAVVAFGAIALRRFRLAHIPQLAVAGCIVLLLIAPIVTRNVTQYRSWALTPQGGAHLALWVVPLVQEAKDGTPWATGAERINRLRDSRFGPSLDNPFEESRRLTIIGKEALADLGYVAIAKAWIVGAVINLAAPSALISTPVFNLPRTGFFATPGVSPPEKIFNFLFRSDNTLYAWIVIAGVAGVALFRLLQLFGFVMLVRVPQTRPVLLLFVMWIGYILAVNGPVASPKYRLPIEPVLMVLAGTGLWKIYDVKRARKSAHS